MALFVMPINGYAEGDGVKRVAILPTIDRTGDKIYGPGICQVVRGKMRIGIQVMPGYEGYDRVNLASIMSELDFQQKGYVSEDQIKEIGRMCGAQYVLINEVSLIDSEHLTILSSLINVESGKDEAVRDCETKRDGESISEACKDLAKRLLNVQSKPTLGYGYGGQSSSNTSSYSHTSSGGDYVETALGLNMRMVYVEGGTFSMGATSEQSGEGDSDESPVHSVTLDNFYIGACEVTQSQWQAVMGTSIQQQAGKAGASSFRGIGGDYPIYYVSWEEAQAFCRELSAVTGRTYLLPTEAQWEYAARGGKQSRSYKYSGSYSIDAVGWYESNSGSSTHPVGRMRANELGIHDMSGNVWEWCSDWYSSSYYSSSASFNPAGPGGGQYRVLRGGSWGHSASYCRVSNREGSTPSGRYYYYGFRVVCLP